MKPLILLLLITNLCYAQLPDTARYSPENVIKITVRKHKNVTTGTNEIISNISSEYETVNVFFQLLVLGRQVTRNENENDKDLIHG